MLVYKCIMIYLCSEFGIVYFLSVWGFVAVINNTESVANAYRGLTLCQALRQALCKC